MFDWAVFGQLLLCSFLPVGLSVIIFLLKKYTKFKKISFGWQQVIIGVVFGAAAIFGTECGVPVAGVATANARDAAPLCAGLLFGGPSGIVAGIIGGVERFFAAYWGKGEYSQIACSVSTALAGFYAAFLRKFMFDHKRPNWGFGVVIGIVMEVIHLLVLYLTHLHDPETAFNVIRAVTIPMIFANSFAVFLSCLILDLLEKKKGKVILKTSSITHKIQLWILGAMVGAFLMSFAFLYAVETNASFNNAEALLKLNVNDIKTDITNQSDSQLESIAKLVREDYLKPLAPDLNELLDKYNISEINIIHKENGVGVIKKSTEPLNVGYVMDNSPQSLVFNILFKGSQFHVDTYVQEFTKIGRDDSIYMKYAGATLSWNSYLQVGYDSTKFNEVIGSKVEYLTSYRHIGDTGYVFIANSEEKLISIPSLTKDVYLSDLNIDVSKHQVISPFEVDIKLEQDKFERTVLMYDTSESFYLFAALPSAEVTNDRDNVLYMVSFVEIIMFAILFAIIYFLLKYLVVDNVRKINKNLGKIINEGDLNVVVNATGSKEFVSLSHDINATVSAMKKYMAEAAARIDQELAFAKSIQHSSLPNIFPAYPTYSNEFDIYADMITAKEVGGDFYDFYMNNTDQLAFLVADVSGKGIPAAMFMMESKTLLKNYCKTCIDVADVVGNTNKTLCSENGAGMFVTCWMGILNFKTGEVKFTNAGHNRPLIYRVGKGWEYLKQKSNLVLAGFEGSKYDTQTLKLNTGDKIFLYTDGVTEATRGDNVLYGEERLLDYLNKHSDLSLSSLINGVKKDIDDFIEGAPQFDDITMLVIEYKNNK